MNSLERPQIGKLKPVLETLRGLKSLPHLLPSSWLVHEQSGSLPQIRFIQPDGRKKIFPESHQGLDLFSLSLLEDESNLTTILDLVQTMLESSDDFQRLSALEWIHQIYADSLFQSSLLTGGHGVLSSLTVYKYRAVIEKRFGIFDGTSGMLLSTEEIVECEQVIGEPPEKKKAQQLKYLTPDETLCFIDRAEDYLKKVVRVPKLTLKMTLELNARLSVSAEHRRRFIRSIDWNDEAVVEDLETDIRQKVKDALVSEPFGNGKKKRDTRKKPPRKVLSHDDLVDVHPLSGVMIRCYTSSKEEKYFETMNPLERFQAICSEIYPVKSTFRDQAFLEQIDQDRLEPDQLLVLRDAFLDVHLADETGEKAYERKKTEGSLDSFRNTISTTSSGAALLEELHIEDLSHCPAWKRELYDILCFHPVPSFFRDELLERLTNRCPQPEEHDGDIPGRREDLKLIQRWYVENGALRNDKYSHRRIAEMEFIFNVIRQLNRSQRIDVLLVVLGIQLENETTREIEAQLHRRLPGVSVNSGRLTRRERENILLEMFEGDIHGIFTAVNEFDKTSPEKLLTQISQNVIREGDGELRLKVSNLIYRILHTCHWTKRLQLTQDILDFSRDKKMTMPQMVKKLLCSLGVVFIKGAQQEGQQNWVPRPYREELIELHDRTPLIPKDKICDILDQEGGYEGAFIGEPLGSASIAQVHRVVLKGGREIALKVMKPGVKNFVQAELNLAEDIIRFVNANENLFGIHVPESLIEEIRVSLEPQLDLLLEREKCEQYGEAVDKQKARLALQDLPVSVVKAIETTSLQSHRTAAYEYVRGIPLTSDEKIGQLAERLGFTCQEIRQQVALALMTVQVGTLIDADYAQMDPNRGNALLSLTGLEKVSEQTRSSLTRTIDMIRAGQYPDETSPLKPRELRQLGLELKLLDFGHIEEVPKTYREMLHWSLWMLVTGDKEGLKNLFIEYHLSSHYEESGRDLKKIPPLNIAQLEKTLMEYFEREFGETTAEIMKTLGQQELSKERFQKILTSFTAKHNFGKVFQDLLEILDQNHIRIPTELMTILRSFRIGSYILEDIQGSDLIALVEKITPKSTLNRVKSGLKDALNNIVPTTVMNLIRSGVRSFLPLRQAVEKENPGQSWHQTILDRVKAQKIDEWFEKLKPKPRQYQLVSAELLHEYRELMESQSPETQKKTQKDGDKYELGVKKITLEMKVDQLPSGTILQFYVSNKNYEFDPQQPEAARIECTVMFLEDFNFSSKKPIMCIRHDGVTKQYGPDVLLTKAIVWYKDQWIRGIDLIAQADPDTSITAGNIDGLSQTIPARFSGVLETLDAQLEKPEEPKKEKLKKKKKKKKGS